MTDDDRNDAQDDERLHNNEPDTVNDDDAGDPAAAFEALRETVEDLAADLSREMTTIRKGVESAFDRLESQGTPIDYSADLGRMTQQLATVAEHLQAIEKSPVLRHGAEHYARTFERSGQGLVSNAAQHFERQATDLERIGRQLAIVTKSAYTRQKQDFRMWIAAAVGIMAGMVLIILLPRFLPFSIDSHVASFVMGLDRVRAGQAMIEVADPKRSQDRVTAGWVYESNRDAIDKCLADMFKTQKEQRCSILLPVVESRK